MQELTGNKRRPFEKSRMAEKRLRGRAAQRRRHRIALRDQFTCQACERVTLHEDGEVDHIVPLSRGGNDDDSNLRWLCVPCHDSKTRAEASERSGKVAIGLDGWPL